MLLGEMLLGEMSFLGIRGNVDRGIDVEPMEREV
jgi:hypothetical protein